MESNSNSKQAMWVAIGQFCSYAIGFITPMILSRYFTREDYGTYKQVMYIYNTLLTVFTLGLPRAYAYFIPKVSIGQSKDIIRKISNIFVLLGIAFSTMLFVGADLIASLLKNSNLAVALRCFSPTPLFLLPVMGLDSILAAYKKTQYLAIYTVATKVLMILCIVLPVVVLKGTYIQAIIGFDISAFLTFLLALYLMKLPTKSVKLVKTSVSYKEVFKFSIPLLTASLWIMVFHSTNQFFISRYYGTAEFAEYSNGFTEFPLIPMVVNSVAIVLLPAFSKMATNNVNGIREVWMNALTKTVKIIYPITVYCIMFASLFMLCMYGDQYVESGKYYVLKNIEGFFAVIPFYPILLALGKTKKYSNIHLLFAIIIVPMQYAVVKFGDSAYLIAVVYMLCAIGKVFLQFFAVSRALRMNLKKLIPFGIMSKVAIVSVFSGVIPLTVTKLFFSLNEYVLLVLSFGIYILCYYTFCWLFRISYKCIIIQYVGEGKLQKVMRYIP